MDFRLVEQKWQQKWSQAKIFQANVDKKKKKFFVTIPYPYMNGSPHVGHSFTFTRGDVYARFKRMQGFNVLFPQGFHATGEPILGTIERVQAGDAGQIETFKQFGATDEDLKNFVKLGPEFVAKYWMQKWIENLKMLGVSVDWRRSFITAVTPTYNRFIEWQYNTLRKKGYVTQGTHPVVWCPHDQSPTGDHDRLVGEGESPLEYIILKFRTESGEIIPCGTLRPETVYGVTNIWVHPDAVYVKAKINNEYWFLGEGAAQRLADQLRNVEIISRIPAEQLIGQFVENPVTKMKIPILPAYFVDPKVGTGLVMSVPSHAPYDWIGLRDLQNHPDRYQKFGIPDGVVNNVRPISLITVEGFGEHPAADIVQRMKIESEGDTDKLDKATGDLYKKEYHTGVLKEITGKFFGKKVSEVKENIVQSFEDSGFAEKIWELTGTVVCRCTTPCHVKILENQWFLKFSDKKWKSLVKKNLKKMKLYPEESRVQFENTIDWLKDKACARKAGLGTQLPWDKEWKVETLSDSTIYMAYYTISHIIESEKIPAENLTDDVFDFVFLGKGIPASVAKKSKLDKKILNRMRDEFEYFYPVDMRNSAKELIPNHLTYMLFHHTAIWPEKFWPRSFSVNGFVQVSGEKMSKSKGNVIPLKSLVERYGSDIVRANITSSNEGMDDADWREDNTESFVSRIKFVENVLIELFRARRKDSQNIDKFLASVVQKRISDATKNYEHLKFRSSTQSAFFEMVSDLKWYIERCGGIEDCNGKILKYFLSNFVKLNAPTMPHAMEEFWSMLGQKGFVSESEWPEADKKLIDEKAEMSESLLRQTMQDVSEIQKIVKIKPKEIRIIVAPSWKFKIYDMTVKMKSADMSSAIKSGLSKSKGANPEDVTKFVQMLYKKRNELQRDYVLKDLQKKILEEGRQFLEKQFRAAVVIEHAEDSKSEKSNKSDVLKPAIVLS